MVQFHYLIHALSKTTQDKKGSKIFTSPPLSSTESFSNNNRDTEDDTL